jgi:hypothetical protein
MKIVIYWRKDKIKSIISHEVWQFWSGGHNFSCSLSSIHKRRRPKRVFLEFAHYRPLNRYGYQEKAEFGVEERARHIKTTKLCKQDFRLGKWDHNVTYLV